MKQTFEDICVTTMAIVIIIAVILIGLNIGDSIGHLIKLPL